MAISQEALDDLTRRGAARGVDPGPGLALVEQRLRTTVAAQLPFLETASRYLVDAGGKRFRPLLVLLSGMLGGREPTHDDLVDAGVVVELIHLSTLYHDDVIDAAEVRRGTPAAHVKWSNSVAILTGDFLLARASELSADLGVEVSRLMARTIAQLCQGEIRELQGTPRPPGEVPPLAGDREHYLRVIAEKTASLISASTRVGALLAALPEEQVTALTDFGFALGMAFQLSDDILDVAGDPGESGKEPGTDLREGVRTLPVLLALEHDGEDSQLARLLDEVARPGQDDAAVARVLALLRDHPSLTLARDAARLEAERAKRTLEPLPRTPATEVLLDGLAELADYAVDRVG